MKSKFMLGAVTLLTFILIAMSATTAMAKPHTFGEQLSASQCDPSGHRMVLNVVFQVTNDADSGVSGNYWALDSYTKHVQAWDMGNSTFCVQVKYNGSFVTVTGPSPGGTGSVDSGVTGTMEGGYSATVTGSFTPGTKRTKGNIGSKDYACTIDQSGPAIGCQYYSFVSDYFTGASLAQNFWQWTYDAGDNGTWVNSINGNSGNITSAP